MLPSPHPRRLQKSNNYLTPVATTAQAVPSPSPAEESPKTKGCTSDTPPPTWAAARQARTPRTPTDNSEEGGEFLWKAGPSPCRLRGRPSLGLIRNGQVRIMTKALLMSCDEVAAGESDRIRSCDEVRCHHASGVEKGLLNTFCKELAVVCYPSACRAIPIELQPACSHITRSAPSLVPLVGLLLSFLSPILTIFFGNARCITSASNRPT